MSVVTAPRPARAPRRSDPGLGDEPRHLHVVRRSRPRRSRRVFATALLAVMFLVLFGTVAFHVQLVKGQQHIEELNRQAEQSQDRYHELRLHLDRLSAPQRIVSKAKSLGMVPAEDPIWLAPTSPGGSVMPGAADPSMRNYLDVKPYLEEVP